MLFRDRTDAGTRLGRILLTSCPDHPVLLGLPRGGIIVAAAVAEVLGVGFEAFVALKVGAPGREELGVGAVAEGLEGTVASEVAAQIGLSEDELRHLSEDPTREMERRVQLYRGARDLPGLSGSNVVVVDDGLATGITAEAALRAIRGSHPATLILAVPVCASDTVARLRAVADDVVYVESTEDLRAVGMWYVDFSPTTDDQVLAALSRVNPPTGRDQ